MKAKVSDCSRVGIKRKIRKYEYSTIKGNEEADEREPNEFAGSEKEDKRGHSIPRHNLPSEIELTVFDEFKEQTYTDENRLEERSSNRLIYN